MNILSAKLCIAYPPNGRRGDGSAHYYFEYNDKALGIEVKSGIGSGRVKGFGKFKEQFPEAMTLIVGKDGIPWEEFIAGKIEHLF